jgi:PAS domain S-box-containing protein
MGLYDARLQRGYVENWQNNPVLQAAEEVYAAVDLDLRFILWNRAAEKATGIPAEAVLGERAPDVIPATGTDASLRAWRRVFDGEKVRLVITSSAPQWGFYATEYITRTPMFSMTGAVIGSLALTRRMRRLKPFVAAMKVVAMLAGVVALALVNGDMGAMDGVDDLAVKLTRGWEEAL